MNLNTVPHYIHQNTCHKQHRLFCHGSCYEHSGWDGLICCSIRKDSEKNKNLEAPYFRQLSFSVSVKPDINPLCRLIIKSSSTLFAEYFDLIDFYPTCTNVNSFRTFPQLKVLSFLVDIHFKPPPDGNVIVEAASTCIKLLLVTATIG